MTDFSRYLSPSAYHDETMKACRLHAIDDFRCDEVKIPKPVGKQLLLKVEACGICGSDIPRAFELGTSKQRYPLTIGHEFGGTIVEVGEDADPALVGQRGAIFPCIPCMHCGPCMTADYAMCTDYDYLGSRSDGGFAEYCLIPSDWHFIPCTNPDLHGDAFGLFEPCTVAQHVIRKSKITAGMNIVIFGAGPIGIMGARWAKIFGADHVIMVDVVEEKCAFAREHGCDEVINSTTTDLLPAIMEMTGGKEIDIAVEGTGFGSALGQCIEVTRTFGTVAMMGNPSRDSTIKLAQHSSILRKELNIVGVWNSHYADTPINEWRFTMKMFDEGRMQVEDLISHRATLEDIPALARGIHDRTINICKAIYSAEV